MTVTRARGAAPAADAASDAASTALSIRLPRIVTRSRAGSDGRQHAVVDPAVLREDQLHAALVGLRRLAQQQRGQHRLADRADHRSVSACASSSSAVANSTASSARPSSISETTVCSRLAASCAWERKRLGEAALGVQLAGERLEFGVVPQRDHRAALLAAARPGWC